MEMFNSSHVQVWSVARGQLGQASRDQSGCKQETYVELWSCGAIQSDRLEELWSYTVR